MALTAQDGASFLFSRLQTFTGQTDTITYTPLADDAVPFQWEAVARREKSGELYDPSTGDMLKVRRCSVTGPTDQLIANGVTALQRNAVLTVNGKDWSVELMHSNWGPDLVTIGLMTREITRHEELEAHGSVR